jgi:hypothetical protein
MHSGRLEIFRIKAHFDFRLRVRQIPLNPGYLLSFPSPNSRDNFRLIKVPLKQVLLCVFDYDFDLS